MSQPKVMGSAAMAATATLPITGSNVALIVATGMAMLVAGFLLVRSGRYQPDAV
jgi:LPXTG-motif cell wall-anchored protein